MAIVWERSGGAFYADADAAGGDRYHLIVEDLPGGGWHWSVFLQTDGSRNVHSGTAGTAQEAMRAAEAAVS